MCEQADDGKAGGLRLGGDDREVLADEGVQERGLPHVGFPGQGDEPAAGHRVIDSLRCTGAALRARRRLSDSTNTEKPIAK